MVMKDSFLPAQMSNVSTFMPRGKTNKLMLKVEKMIVRSLLGLNVKNPIHMSSVFMTSSDSVLPSDN